MHHNTLNITIEKLAGLGDGVGMHNGRKIFIPYTQAGDVVEAEIIKTTKDADYAQLRSILIPSPYRKTPVCRHFGVCGGCSLQHLPATHYTEFKQQMAQEAIRKAGYNLSAQPLIQINADTRRRAELKVNAGKVGYYAANSHQLVDMEECFVLEPALFALVMALKQALALSEVTAVHINAVEQGYDVVLTGGGENLPRLPGIQRLSVRRGELLTVIYQQGEVVVNIAGNKVMIPAESFLQVSQQTQDIMGALITAALSEAMRIVDLFAGIGTYSFALARHAMVFAVEGDKAMTAAINAAGHPKLKAVHRDLFHQPLLAEELRSFDAAVINPPRAGAKAQTEQLVLARVPHIVMVSCNPATFTRDARLLHTAGYNLKKLTPIDQFVYSSHLELVAEFSL